MMRRGVLVLSMLCACGPNKSDPAEGTGSDTGGATSDDTGSNTGSVTGTPTGTATDTPTTDEPVSCDAFLPPPPEAFKPVEITIVSELAVPVWIGAVGCGGLPLLRILDADAGDVYDNPSECFPVLCDQFLGAEDCSPGCNDCGAASARRIGPGSTLTLSWSAVRGVPMEMTAQCAPGMNCQRECLRLEPVAAGEYSVELTAFRSCTGQCECDVPDPGASCPLWEPIETAEPFDVKKTLSYPETGAIELVLMEP